MGQVALARTAKAHAVRAVLLAGAVLAVVIALILGMAWGLAGAFVPFGWRTAVLGGIVLAAGAVALLPLELVGDAIVAELRAENADAGRLRNVAEELSIAIGEPADHVVVHDTEIPNVGTFPTSNGVVVMATTRAVEQLNRAELEALVAAQFAGMRDPWCRLATRAELVWKGTIALAFASPLVAVPIPVFIGAGMLVMPKIVEATRDLCADVAAVNATRHPAALAGALRHLTPSSSDGNRQRLVAKWYLPVSPFLVLPKRVKSTTTVSVGDQPKRTYTDAQEVALELELRAERAEALAAGADPRDYTGREYRRRWSRLGLKD